MSVCVANLQPQEPEKDWLQDRGYLRGPQNRAHCRVLRSFQPSTRLERLFPQRPVENFLVPYVACPRAVGSLNNPFVGRRTLPWNATYATYADPAQGYHEWVTISCYQRRSCVDIGGSFLSKDRDTCGVLASISRPRRCARPLSARRAPLWVCASEVPPSSCQATACSPRT